MKIERGIRDLETTLSLISEKFQIFSTGSISILVRTKNISEITEAIEFIKSNLEIIFTKANQIEEDLKDLNTEVQLAYTKK